MIPDSYYWLPILYLILGSVALLVWRCSSWGSPTARYLSFGAVVLLMAFLNRVLYTIDFLIAGTRFDAWPFPVEEPAWALAKGELLTVGGILITFWTWKAAGGQRVRLQDVVMHSRRDKRLLHVTYALSVAGIVSSRMFPTVAELTGQLLPVLHSMGIGAAVLLALSTVSRPFAQFSTALLLCIPFIADAMGKGMKESLILALLPVAFFAWRAVPSKAGRLGMITAGVFLTGLLTAYVNYFRAEIWIQQSGASTVEVAESFIESMAEDGVVEVLGDGVEGFLARNNASYHRGWAVSIADVRGFYPELVFEPLVYVFVPRILWPEKPAIRQGWEYSGIVFGADYIKWSESSTAAGLYTAFYLGGGITSVLLGAFALGLIVALSTRGAAQLGGRTAALLYMSTLISFAMRLDETWTVGALTGPIISLVYVLFLMLVMRVMKALFWDGSKALRVRL